MSPLSYLVNGEYVHTTASVRDLRAAIVRVGIAADGTLISFTRFARAVSRRRKQVEGVSYGNPQLIHRGRKPTARRRR